MEPTDIANSSASFPLPDLDGPGSRALPGEQEKFARLKASDPRLSSRRAVERVQPGVKSEAAKKKATRWDANEEICARIEYLRAFICDLVGLTDREIINSITAIAQDSETPRTVRLDALKELARLKGMYKTEINSRPVNFHLDLSGSSRYNGTAESEGEGGGGGNE